MRRKLAQTTAARALVATSLATVVGASILVTGCRREDRQFTAAPPAGAARFPRTSDLQPGPEYVVDSTKGPYDDDAYAISEGKTLFAEMNCVGCHSHGGGGMGPPLMDAEWIYGSDPAQIFATIVQGRPNGMPSFRGKLTNDQVWMIEAYVRTMAGMGRRDLKSGRDDAMYMRSSEQNTNTKPPHSGGVPPASQFP